MRKRKDMTPEERAESVAIIVTAAIVVACACFVVALFVALL